MLIFFFYYLEETYDRVMKYGDEQVNVKIHINDVENMVSSITYCDVNAIKVE
jgi:hypothetical protein